MPDLAHTLQGHDLNFLKMVAEAWGVEINAPDVRSARPELEQYLLDGDLADEVVSALPAEARSALQVLYENEGRLPWAVFARRFGEVRPLGAAARDRERPDLRPNSPAETLWYRALIGRAFLNIPPEPQEFAYIPDDLLELFAVLDTFNEPAPKVPGRPASPAETAHQRPANDRILNLATTLLAALRLGLRPNEYPTAAWPSPPEVLTELLRAAGLLDKPGIPLPEPTRAFLEAPRGKALAQMAAAWIKSPTFNDLRHIPGLVFEGEWHNDPLNARQVILEILSHLPQGEWWNLASFISAVREIRPDFQRPGGDYDSWFIREQGSEEFLRGFASWDAVDGALIRHLITGPLHWLGMVDLAAPSADAPIAAFRFSSWAEALWHGQPPEGLPEESGSLKVQADGRISVPVQAPRVLRYQVARFCAWLPPAKDEYRYQITPASLERAAKQGLKPAHLLTLLKRSTQTLPPTLLQALERWEQNGVEVRLESVVLLRASNAEVLAAIRATRAARFLSEDLNPTTALVKPGNEEKLLQALAEAGYLAQARLEGTASAV